MPKVLVNGEWFARLSSTALLESDFERLIVRQAGTLFPEYEMVDFKTDIQSEHGTRKPDFALIHRSYQMWWVVEVEMSYHSLYGHVIPQVQVFSNGSYGSDEASYLRAQAPSLDAESLAEMMRGAPPRVLVIANEPVPDWLPPLRAHNSLLAILEVYRSGRNDHVLRANGEYPEVPGDVLSLCRVEPLLPQMLRVESPIALGVKDGEPISIEYAGGLTEWRRKDVKDKVWLCPPGGINPLAALGSVAIVRREDGRLAFELARRGGGLK